MCLEKSTSNMRRMEYKLQEAERLQLILCLQAELGALPSYSFFSFLYQRKIVVCR
jgi:hypothetical protein